MSKAYKQEHVSSRSKHESRKAVAKDMQSFGTKETVIHYLGGTRNQLIFEELFRNRQKTTSFVRYERDKTDCPNRYLDYLDYHFYKHIFNSKDESGHIIGGFVQGDVFENFPEVVKNHSDKRNFLWLDFCGTVSHNMEYDLMDVIFPYIDKTPETVCYITFYLNARNCENTKEIFKGNGKSIQERLQAVCDRFQETFDNGVCEEEYLIDEPQHVKVEPFYIYNNGKSPMGIIKITNMKTKTNKVAEYATLSKRGFTNKQIAVFWRMRLMQVAGYAASAKRQGLI